MANDVVARLLEEQEKQELELVSYLESIESAKWEIWRNLKFIYGIEIEFHDLELYLTKLIQEIKS